MEIPMPMLARKPDKNLKILLLSLNMNNCVIPSKKVGKIIKIPNKNK